MKNLKKTDDACVDQPMHNIEDARVKIDSVKDKIPERKNVRVLKVVFLTAARFFFKRLLNWILENPDSVLEILHIVKVFFEALAL